MDPLPALTDDGLATPEVGNWAEDKYQLVRCYAEIFATGMKKRWECLVYIDLFAGAGRARIADSTRIVPASPLVVLGIPNPFTKYIFCEFDPAKMDALRKRVGSAFPERDVLYVEGDCNARVDDIAELIPKFSKAHRVLSFCFADPFNLGDLAFTTLERLSRNRRIDFLVLIASGMDAHRNRDRYLQTDNHAVTSFVGNDEWRARWPKPRSTFGDFVADEFGSSMKRLDYLYEGLPSLQHVRSTEKNLALYHLGVFSKHARGNDFWKKCRESATPQRLLFR